MSTSPASEALFETYATLFLHMPTESRAIACLCCESSIVSGSICREKTDGSLDGIHQDTRKTAEQQLGWTMRHKVK